jgi:hypothetical protein
MAWRNQDSGDKRVYHPVSVRKAGYAGIVGDQDLEAEMREEDPREGFDEDLYDETSPEPTSEERAHYEEHGEHPESYYERHDQAYAEAMQKKADESRLDHDDPGLMHFVVNHGSNTKLWHDYGRTGKISLRGPVWATQSHVAREHIDKYKADPNAMSWHESRYGRRPAGSEYLGNEHPMFVTHEGRLHVTEGHHRVAAALERGEKTIHGAHFNLDEHPQLTAEDDDEDYW